MAGAIATANGRTPRASRHDPRGENYKWVALSNCTLGVLIATLDASITLIAMPDIFDGIKLDPLVPGNAPTCERDDPVTRSGARAPPVRGRIGRCSASGC